MPEYVPKRKLLSDPAAIRALEGALKNTTAGLDFFCFEVFH